VTEGVSEFEQPVDTFASARDGNCLYRQPSDEILDILHARAEPHVLCSAIREFIVLLDFVRSGSVAELAKPAINLAGLSINTRNNGPRRASRFVRLRLKRMGAEHDVSVMVPHGARISYPYFAEIFMSVRYQRGYLRCKKRKSGGECWEFMWREREASGKNTHRTVVIGTTEQYPTAELAQAAVNGLRMQLNDARNRLPQQSILVGDLIDHYLNTELAASWHSHATRFIYREFLIRWIRPNWGAFNIREVRTIAVESWLRQALTCVSSFERSIPTGLYFFVPAGHHLNT
jgi:hypothetical protein